MTLKEYKKKRDSGKLLYVIQKHQATRLHYDLRLEIDGVLKSWALPKEPPAKEGVKRLAVQTEDHPLDYASFEGEIPEGHYGAGTVKLWDSGIYEMINRKDYKMVIKINGKKLKGDYVLLRIRLKEQKNNWLFFKKKE